MRRFVVERELASGVELGVEFVVVDVEAGEPPVGM